MAAALRKSGGLVLTRMWQRTCALQTRDVSSDQAKDVQESWKLVSADITGNGAALLAEFFTVYPDYKDLFGPFKGVALSDLGTDAKAAAHVNVVMNSLGTIVGKLNDAGGLDSYLKEMAINHKNRNVGAKQFQDISGVIVEFLGKRLGDAYTPQVKASWTAALNDLSSGIEAGQK